MANSSSTYRQSPGRGRRRHLLLAMISAAALMLLTGFIAPVASAQPVPSKTWSSANRSTSCAAGKTVKLFIQANYIGYKQFHAKSASDTYWRTSSLTGYLGQAFAWDTNRRSVTWYLTVMPDSNPNIGSSAPIPSRAFYAVCQ